LHIGKPKEVLGKIKSDMVFGADGAFQEFATACNDKVCSTIHRIFNMDIRTKYSITQMAPIN
jgi:hypothetical protein